MKKRHLLIAATISMVACVYSCKKELNPTKDSVTQSAGAGSAAYLNSIVLGAYTQLQSMTANNSMLLTSEETTDALIVPARIGGDWLDAGLWQPLWIHTYGPGNSNFADAWDNCYNAIGQINITIDLLKGLPATSGTAYSISELQTLRDYYYFLLLTNYGKIPYITSSSTDASTIANQPATDTYNALVTELSANAPKLSAKTPAQDPSQYGRLNKWGAYFLLAKLYLNQGVITGQNAADGYTKCSALCDSLMGAGYSLTPDFLSNFASSNNASPENIFVIPFDHVYAPGFQYQMMTFHYNQAAKYNWGSTGGPWNGFCANADYYKTFNDADTRKAGWQHGIQYAADGVTPLTTRASDSSLVLNFRPQVSSLYKATEYDGVRQQKWELTPGSQNQDADFALFRYADVLLMKAECVMRLGNPAGALPYIAPVRTRAGLANFTAGAFNADSLLAERGREFVWEGWRRQDLIRFQHFGDKKQFKTTFEAPGDYRELLPIPTRALLKNTHLTQNNGYTQ
jgi:hypothetical protein